MHTFRIAVFKKGRLVYCKCMACCNVKSAWNRLFALRVRSVNSDMKQGNSIWTNASILKNKRFTKIFSNLLQVLKRSRWSLVVVIWPNLWPLVFGLCRGQLKSYHRVLLDRRGDEQLVWAFERTNWGQWWQCNRTRDIHKNQGTGKSTFNQNYLYLLAAKLKYKTINIYTKTKKSVNSGQSD